MKLFETAPCPIVVSCECGALGRARATPASKPSNQKNKTFHEKHSLKAFEMKKNLSDDINLLNPTCFETPLLTGLSRQFNLLIFQRFTMVQQKDRFVTLESF